MFSVRSAREMGSSAHLHQLASAQMPFIIPGGGEDLGPPTRLAVLLVGRRVGRRRDRPELTVVLVVGAGREEQRVGARFGTAAQRSGSTVHRSSAVFRRGRLADHENPRPS